MGQRWRGGESAAISFVAFGLGKVAPHFMHSAQYHMAGATTISNRKWDNLSGTFEYLLGKYVEAGGPVHELTEEHLAAWRAKVEPN